MAQENFRNYSLPALLLAMAMFCLPTQAAELAIVGNNQGPQSLSLPDLQKIEASEIKTRTQWTEGEQHFVGVRGSRLAVALKASGKEIHAEAANGYRVIIPFEVFASDDLLVAYMRNGKPMELRDKGPFWVVFPFDKGGKYASHAYTSYAIWNLTKLEFR